MAGWSCAACAGDNPFGMPFCGHCGTRDEEGRALPTELWGCRSCGAANGEVMAFCGRCGSKRGVERVDDLRLVTALFADISGFTTLADTLDAEDLHAVINPLIAGLAGIAERYGGFIAKYAGDALLCLFGAPIAHEDDAQRALLAAYEMQAGLPAMLAQLGPAAKGLTIHIGVNTGRVVAGAVGSAAQNDYSVLGDSVILAQRLESVCPSGQTYVGESTRELCKDEFDFEDVGELQLKGKLTLVRAFRLVGRKRLGSDASRPLVGREIELATVLGGLQGGGAVLVSGEPGVGKSRLLAETRLRATRNGAWWLQMRCLSYGASLAYWPFIDLVRQALGLRVEDAPTDVLARLRTTLPADHVAGAARLLGQPVDELEPEAARRQVHNALIGMLAFLAGDRPIVLAVEDAHWIDASSSDVLGEMLRVPDGMPLSVVLSTRPEGVEACEQLLSQARSGTIVELEPLGPEAIPLLATAVVGAPVTGTALDLVVERTHGNPLFVEELLRSLQEEDALVTTSAGFDLRPGFDVEAVPQTVERVFSARVDALPLPALAVLSIASVVGRVVRLTLLSRVAGANGTDLAPLDHLVDAGLLERVSDQNEPAVTFHHALLQDVVYGRLLKKQKVALHRTVADAGLALYGDGDETLDLLARHLFLAEAGEQALEALLRAGRRAARLYANDAAAEHFRRALEVLDTLATSAATARRTVDTLLELASVDDIRGAYDDALATYERARTLDTTRLSAWVGAAAVMRKQGRYMEALDLLAQRPAPTPVSLLLERARNEFRSGEVGPSLETVNEAMAAALTPVESTDCLMELATIESQTGRFEPAAEHAERALKALVTAGDVRGQAKAQRMLGSIYSDLGDLDRASVSLQRAAGLAEQVGDVEEVGGTLLNLGIVHSRRDELAAAVDVTKAAAARFERLGHGVGRATCYSNLADMHLGLNNTSEARTWAERSIHAGREIGHPRVEAVARLTLAEIDIADGLREAAAEQLARARATFEELGVDDMVGYCDKVRSTLDDLSPAAS